MDQVKFFKGYLSQVLPGAFLNTLSYKQLLGIVAKFLLTLNEF